MNPKPALNHIAFRNFKCPKTNTTRYRAEVNLYAELTVSNLHPHPPESMIVERLTKDLDALIYGTLEWERRKAVCELLAATAFADTHPEKVHEAAAHLISLFTP